MNILMRMIELMASFIEIFLLFKIYDKLLNLGKKVNSRHGDIVVSVIGVLLITICNKIELISLITIVVFAVYTAAMALIFYRTSFILTYSISSFYALCIAVFDVAAATIVASFFNEGETFEMFFSINIHRSFYIIAVKICLILFYLFIKKYLEKFIDKTRYANVLLVFSVMGMIGTVFLFKITLDAFHIKLMGMWLFLFCLLIFGLYSIYYIAISKEETLKIQYANKHNLLLEENYRVLNDIYTSNAKLYHDLNNHLLVLRQLLEEEKADQAKQYIEEIRKPLQKFPTKIH